MAQHKAPTSVTIAPTVEKSGFALLVERFWKPAAVVVLALAALIIYWEYSHQSRRAQDDRSWERLMQMASPDPSTGVLTGPARELAALEPEVKGTQAGPWTLFIAAHSAVSKRQFSEAKSALGELRRLYPDHPLVVETFPLETPTEPLSPVAALEKRTLDGEAWVAAHPALYQNPPLPDGSPRVRINTDRGAIVVGLDATRAPKHVENFMKLVREGYYTGTKFHSVVKGSMIEGGDPNSIQGDVATWGKGGPDYKLDVEASQLRHFAGVISSVNHPGTRTSSGSQFAITTGDVHMQDGQTVVFGVVLEGLDVVSQIEAGTIVEGTTRPADPVAIQSAEVL